MTPEERVHIDRETGIVSVWHDGAYAPVVHSESGEHCGPVATDIRAAIAEAEADARADERGRLIAKLRELGPVGECKCALCGALAELVDKIQEPPAASEEDE